MSEPDWKRRYEDECAIVDRVWRALGVTGGVQELAIDQQVAAIRMQVFELRAALDSLRVVRDRLVLENSELRVRIAELESGR